MKCGSIKGRMSFLRGIPMHSRIRHGGIKAAWHNLTLKSRGGYYHDEAFVLSAALLAWHFFFGSGYGLQAATARWRRYLADKAVAYWKANGKDKAIAAFNDPKGQFVKGDVSCVVQAFDGVVVATAAIRRLWARACSSRRTR